VGARFARAPSSKRLRRFADAAASRHGTPRRRASWPAARTTPPRSCRRAAARPAPGCTPLPQTNLPVAVRLTRCRSHRQARDEYFSLIESHIESLKSKGVALSADAVAAVRAAVADGRAKASCEAHAALDKVSAAWEAVVSSPQVAAALGKAAPAVAAAKDKAVAAASYVAASPLYQTYVAPRVSALASRPAVAAAWGRVSALAQPLVAAF
jgi:hypothetical protein